MRKLVLSLFAALSLAPVATAANYEYLAYIDGRPIMYGTIKNPGTIQAGVEVQPRNPYCSKFDVQFGPVTTWGGAPGFNTTFTAGYPNASVSWVPGGFRSVSWPAGNYYGCQAFVGGAPLIGAANNANGTPAPPTDFQGYQTWSGAQLYSFGSEIMLTPYWLYGNLNCATMPGYACDWIEVGEYVGNAGACSGGWTSTPRPYIEWLRNRTSTSFNGQGTCYPVNGTIHGERWEQADGTRSFVTLDSPYPYGSTHSFRLLLTSIR